MLIVEQKCFFQPPLDTLVSSCPPLSSTTSWSQPWGRSGKTPSRICTIPSSSSLLLLHLHQLWPSRPKIIQRKSFFTFYVIFNIFFDGIFSVVPLRFIQFEWSFEERLTLTKIVPFFSRLIGPFFINVRIALKQRTVRSLFNHSWTQRYFKTFNIFYSHLLHLVTIHS